MGAVPLKTPQMELNFWLSLSVKQRQNSFSGPSTVYQELSMHHNWPVNKAIVNLPIRLRGNSKRIPGNSMSQLRAQGWYLGNELQTLLTEVRLY